MRLMLYGLFAYRLFQVQLSPAVFGRSSLVRKGVRFSSGAPSSNLADEIGNKRARGPARRVLVPFFSTVSAGRVAASATFFKIGKTNNRAFQARGEPHKTAVFAAALSPLNAKVGNSQHHRRSCKRIIRGHRVRMGESAQAILSKHPPGVILDITRQRMGESAQARR
jgi:hypothetical protein